MELTLDCETSTFMGGNPYSRHNVLCTVGCLGHGGYRDFVIEYSTDPYGSSLEEIKRLVESASLVIGFNLKFDLAWLKRYMPYLKIPPVWDCQVAEYYLSGQEMMFPSLDDCLTKYGIPNKLSEVAAMWDQGLDTTDIPLDILLPYQKRDVISTYALYQKQLKHPEYPKLQKYLDMQMRDVVLLMEMEFMGLKFDPESCMIHKQEVVAEQQKLLKKLAKLTGSDINWKSPKQVSIYLFGGTIGEKVYPRLIEPDPRSEGAATVGKSDAELEQINKERLESKPKKVPIQRVWSVDESCLHRGKHRGNIKKIVDMLLEYKKMSKLIGTYLEGVPEIVSEMDWPDNLIHGTFNCVATRTGRLSSSKPNLQNFPEEMERHVISRYKATTAA